MRTFWRAILFIALSVLLSGSASLVPNNLLLIAVMGDSNAAGQAPLSGIVTIHNDRLWTFTRGGEWQHAFEPMASIESGSLYPVLEATPIGSGFALPLAQELADRNIGVVNVGVGGSSIAQHLPSFDTKTIYGAGHALIKTASANGRVRIVIYSGGVREAQNIEAANSLVANFSTIVNQLRKDYGNDLIVFHLQLGDDPNDALHFPYWQQAKMQQAMVNIPGVYMVATDGIEKQADKIHYTATGYSVIGKKIARSYRGLSAF